MPRIFVYESLTVSGVGRKPDSPGHSLYREGLAMRDALADDLRRIPDTDVHFPTQRLRASAHEQYRRLTDGCDFLFLIAPEQELVDLRRGADRAGVRVLGCTEAAIELTGSKLALARQWAEAGVPTPRTEPVPGWAKRPIEYPAVVKLDWGAGSQMTMLAESRSWLRQVIEFATDTEGMPEADFLIQQFVPGRPASVAFLIGPNQTIPLLPTFQHLSTDGRFQYLGGELPIPSDLARRAVALGLRATSSVIGLAGYVGVDMILGDAADGSEDYAIEINPRLTTSYVGLRVIAETNLAQAMIDVCEGRPVEPIRWKPGRVRFEPDGVVAHDPTPGAVFS